MSHWYNCYSGFLYLSLSHIINFSSMCIAKFIRLVGGIPLLELEVSFVVFLPHRVMLSLLISSFALPTPLWNQRYNYCSLSTKRYSHMYDWICSRYVHAHSIPNNWRTLGRYYLNVLCRVTIPQWYRNFCTHLCSFREQPPKATMMRPYKPRYIHTCYSW